MRGDPKYDKIIGGTLGNAPLSGGFIAIQQNMLSDRAQYLAEHEGPSMPRHLNDRQQYIMKLLDDIAGVEKFRPSIGAQDRLADTRTDWAAFLETLKTDGKIEGSHSDCYYSPTASDSESAQSDEETNLRYARPPRRHRRPIVYSPDVTKLAGELARHAHAIQKAFHDFDESGSVLPAPFRELCQGFNFIQRCSKRIQESCTTVDAATSKVDQHVEDAAAVVSETDSLFLDQLN